jgi:hypothetical protein
VDDCDFHAIANANLRANGSGISSGHGSVAVGFKARADSDGKLRGQGTSRTLSYFGAVAN